MSYNKQNYRRIREEYSTKYLKDREAADLRREEVHAAIPETEELDRQLKGVGLKILDAAMKCDDYEKRLRELKQENETLLDARRRLLEAHGYEANYTEVQYECPLCGDTGFVDGKMCRCMRQKLVEAAYETSGISRLLLTQSFDNFSLSYYRDDPDTLTQMTRIYRIMKQYAGEFRPGESGNLVLFGHTGLGKTHLSTAVARTVIEKGCDVYYTGAVPMLADFEAERFGNGTVAASGLGTERYTECDLLIIDDLGTEILNQFTTSVLYYIINTRLNCARSTIISTNLTVEEFRRHYWDRITSRILGDYTVLPFVGRDIREQKHRRPSGSPDHT